MLSKNNYITRSLTNIVLLLIIFMSFGAYGQLSTSIKDNNLDNSKNLMIGTTILGIDVYDPNLNFFSEANLNYRFKKEFGYISGHYKIAWADRLEEVTESTQMLEAIPAKGTQPLKEIGLSFGFNFIKKEEFKSARSTFMVRSFSRKFSLPLKSYRIYGMHIGFDKYQTILAQGSTMSYSGAIVANFPKDTVITANNATPMFRANIISVGIHRTFLNHAEIQVNNGGTITKLSNKFVSTVYADFLIGTKMLLDNILVPLNEYAPNSNPPGTGTSYANSSFNFYEVDVNKSYKKVPIGGRLGWDMTILNSFGSHVGFEAGFRPGFVSPIDNIYLMFKIGFSINCKLK